MGPKEKLDMLTSQDFRELLEAWMKVEAWVNEHHADKTAGERYLICVGIMTEQLFGKEGPK